MPHKKLDSWNHMKIKTSEEIVENHEGIRGYDKSFHQESPTGGF
jgi:hypothetical protein